jgi:hypothetical protein
MGLLTLGTGRVSCSLPSFRKSAHATCLGVGEFEESISTVTRLGQSNKDASDNSPKDRHNPRGERVPLACGASRSIADRCAYMGIEKPLGKSRPLLYPECLITCPIPFPSWKLNYASLDSYNPQHRDVLQTSTTKGRSRAYKCRSWRFLPASQGTTTPL